MRWREPAAQVLRHPRLYATAIRQLLRLAPRGWWRRWPPAPAPAQAWLEFRQETQYGSKDAPVKAGDVVAWLEWCRELRRSGRVHRDPPERLVASRRTR